MLTRLNGHLGSNGWSHFADLSRSLRAVDQIRTEMDRLFEDVGRPWGLYPMARDHALEAPRMELSDAGKELVLHAELPGFAERDIEISLDRRTLTIRGQRGTAAPEGYQTVRQERGALQFDHTFALPCPVEADEVVATLKNGVLELRLPKAAEAQPRKIKVDAS